MATKDNCKVLIVGGGVAGLTLAIMLERFGIDYLVLEAHPEIAPDAGASIGLFPNGLRILDQMGCYEDILKLPIMPINVNRMRNLDKGGASEAVFLRCHDHFVQRHGYGVLFFDRQWLLQVLYAKVQHKQRILLGKKVTKIDHLPGNGGVRINAADGTAFNGTMVLGVDGIHSTVRQAMFNLADKIQPGYLDSGEADRVPCYVQCSFGMAQDVPNYTPGEMNTSRGKGFSQLVVPGADGKVYWFVFVRLPHIKFGRNVPRYTEQDELAFAEKYGHVPVTDKVTFGDVFARRISSALTPIHEVVFKKWFFQRMLIFGDAAHKPDPIGGQGANGAIESAAEFINALVRLKHSRPSGLNNLADAEISSVFQHVQSRRQARAKSLVALAHRQQEVNSSFRPWVTSLVWRVMAPVMGREFALRHVALPILGASRLEVLPLVKRPRLVPFDDERPAKPLGWAASVLLWALFAGAMIALLYVAGTTGCLDPTGFAACNQDAMLPSTAEAFMARLVSRVSGILEGSNTDMAAAAAQKLQLSYFVLQLTSPFLVFLVEGHRSGHYGSPLALPTLFLAATQILGIGRVAPVYALLHAVLGDMFAAGRPLKSEVAQGIVPALTLGYIVPALFMLVTPATSSALQDWTFLWHISPLVTPALVNLYAAGTRWLKRSSLADKKVDDEMELEEEAEEEDETFESVVDKDVEALKAAYACAFAVQAACHVLTLLRVYYSSVLTLYDVFLNLPNPLLLEEWAATSEASLFFKYDMVLAAAAFACFNLFTVWKLRSAGYVKSSQAVKAALYVAVGQVAVGPGATWAGLWYWREGVFASLGMKEDETVTEATA